MKYATVVYQAGIANVFTHNMCLGNDGRKRLLQSDFRTCEAFARGMQAAGFRVRSAWCNEAGDIANSSWNYSNFDAATFCESFRHVDPIAAAEHA